MITVILLAAGSSIRFGRGRSKLLEKVCGKRIIDITIDSIYSSIIDPKIVLVSSYQFKEEIGRNLEWVEGGARRQDSAKNGIMSIQSEVYFIHDAARPFISKVLTERLLNGLSYLDGVAPAIRITDTLKKVSENRIIATLDRNELYAVQTPQAIKGEAARRAFSSADWSQEYTDDLEVLESAGFRTGIVEGDPENIKITTPFDLLLAEALYKKRMNNE